jgi:DNA-binding GntR family transcriptional regulator
MAALLKLEVTKSPAAPLRQQVEGVLRQAIIDGKLAPGQRLTERALTEMTGVSRTLVREALRQLEAEDLIVVIPNRGPVVRELTITEGQDLYAIRAVLEGFAARRFVEHADDTALKGLLEVGEAVIAAYRQGDSVQALNAKNLFYDLLFEGAASETLSKMLASLHARIWRWRALGVTHPRRSPQRANEAAQGMRDICEAMRNRDGDAAERATREEVNRGAVEVMHLLAKPVSAPRASSG